LKSWSMQNQTKNQNVRVSRHNIHEKPVHICCVEPEQLVGL